MESSDVLLADGVPVRSKVVSQGDEGGGLSHLSPLHVLLPFPQGPSRIAKIPLTDFTSNKAQ